MVPFCQLTSMTSIFQYRISRGSSVAFGCCVQCRGVLKGLSCWEMSGLNWADRGDILKRSAYFYLFLCMLFGKNIKLLASAICTNLISEIVVHCQGIYNDEQDTLGVFFFLITLCSVIIYGHWDSYFLANSKSHTTVLICFRVQMHCLREMR